MASILMCDLLSMESEQEKVARYVQRATELRAIAALAEDLVVRAVLLKGAEAYECIANWKPKNWDRSAIPPSGSAAHHDVPLDIEVSDADMRVG